MATIIYLFFLLLKMILMKGLYNLIIHKLIIFITTFQMLNKFFKMRATVFD